MADLQSALAGASHAVPPARERTRRVLVVGAGGALGAAVLEQLLATHRFERVAALVDQPIRAAVHRFVALPDDDASLRGYAADVALVVFDRARAANGREDAFVRPDPAALPKWAARFYASGTRSLIVVVPHTPSLLPMALQQGLATLDEAAVAALGFERLVFMRTAQDDRGADGLSAPQRLARWMLSQLRWMIPERELPVRSQTVAEVAAALAALLGDVPPATRVVPAALLWQAARTQDVSALVRGWLAPASD